MAPHAVRRTASRLVAPSRPTPMPTAPFGYRPRGSTDQSGSFRRSRLRVRIAPWTPPRTRHRHKSCDAVPLLSPHFGELAERQGTAVLTRRDVDEMSGRFDSSTLRCDVQWQLFFDKRRARERRHSAAEARPPVTRKVAGSIPAGVAVDSKIGSGNSTVESRLENPVMKVQLLPVPLLLA